MQDFFYQRYLSRFAAIQRLLLFVSVRHGFFHSCHDCLCFFGWWINYQLDINCNSDGKAMRPWPDSIRYQEIRVRRQKETVEKLQITAPWYLEGLQWAPSWGQLQYSNWIQLAKLFCNISTLEEIKRSQESPGEAPIHQLPRFGLNRYGFWTLAVDAALAPVSRVHCMSRNISIKLMCSMCFTGIHVCHWSCLSNGCKSIRLVGHLNQGKESIKSCSNSSGPWRWKLVISLIGVMGRNF